MRYMKTHARGWLIVRMVASGLAAALVGQVLTTAVTAKKIEKRNIKITNRSPADKLCLHDVDHDKAYLKKNVDDIEWTVTNKCKNDQDVLICVYRLNPAVHLENPFGPCSSKPPGANLESPFPVPANDKVILTCPAVGADDQYRKQVLVGPEIPSDRACPSMPLKSLHGQGERRLMHQLDVEIQP